MSEDIVERLLTDKRRDYFGDLYTPTLNVVAADEIQRLRAENARLLEEYASVCKLFSALQDQFYESQANLAEYEKQEKPHEQL